MNEIEELVRSFCEKHLNDELMGYALKLCDTLGRKKSQKRRLTFLAVERRYELPQ